MYIYLKDDQTGFSVNDIYSLLHYLSFPIMHFMKRIYSETPEYRMWSLIYLSLYNSQIPLTKIPSVPNMACDPKIY